MHRALLIIALVSLAPHAGAEPHWGTFEDHGCVNPDTRPGLREYSARLWGIPWGASWEDTCAATGATFGDYTFDHPAVCVNAMRAFGQTLCFVVDAGWQLCHKVHTQTVIMSWSDVTWPYGNTPGALDPALTGWVPDWAQGEWRAVLNDVVHDRGTYQQRESNGGHSMWGTFFVADETCLPPDYHRLARPEASWDDAARTCRDRGQYLCTRDEICEAGEPLPGQPAGDVWVAVADAPDEWVSVGTAYPERTCRTHTEVTGSVPGWSSGGPEPITGQPSAARCCDCQVGCFNRP